MRTVAFQHIICALVIGLGTGCESKPETSSHEEVATVTSPVQTTTEVVTESPKPVDEVVEPPGAEDMGEAPNAQGGASAPGWLGSDNDLVEDASDMIAPDLSTPDMSASAPVKASGVTNGAPQVRGSLDKESIRKVVRRHKSEIRYCYEKGLASNPKLAGTVKVKFVISGTGSVMSATISSTDLNDSAVEQCMTRKIRRWTFPEPKGGGIVNVNYPFVFST